MTRSKGPCPLVWACATTDTLAICYRYYHTCHGTAGHEGDCWSATGPEHTSAMRYGDVVTSVTAVYELLGSLGGGRPAWLDDHRAQELARFRARFTDPQWQLFVAGYCSHPAPPDADREWCARGRRHGRVLCDEHVREVRQAGEWEPSATSVPSAVTSMDLAEVP